MTRGASISSSFNYQWTYDVFINFRGEDTRHGFTGHLYSALSRKGIHTFMDDEKLRKGNEITPTLLKAIEESRMAITVFSKNYASSTFCLNELITILQYIKGNGRLVWPIFYDVEPSDVRHQKGNYEEALAMHKKNFKADEEEMQRWKLALCEVANLSGSHFNPRYGQYEYQFIERIVNEISSKINRVPLHVAKYPVGLESRMLKINSLLRLGSKDNVNMVGICGIKGIGKSTIARAMYNSIADNFEGLCFLHDIKENSRKHGLEQMQERMLSKIVGVDIKVEDVNEGVPIIKMRLNHKKILLILDNVDKQEQLEKLAGDCNWFGYGSRIIITTRDKQLLVRHRVERIYDMEAFNYKESLELLSWNAFGNNQVDPNYKEVFNHIVRYVQGLPLALEVIGSHLFGMSISECESVLDVCRRIPSEDIQQILSLNVVLDMMTGRASASSSFTHDVFINFRGEDTRYGFKGNLCKALKEKGIRTFMDDEKLRKGDEITSTLLKAIEESRMAIIIFSKNYASSTFCLNELIKIIQCIKGKGRLILPIFYDVDPSDVRHQKGNYEEALAMHKKNLKVDEKEMQSWKLALREVANISGFQFSLRHGPYEYEFIERIVKEISSEINRVP